MTAISRAFIRCALFPDGKLEVHHQELLSVALVIGLLIAPSTNACPQLGARLPAQAVMVCWTLKSVRDQHAKGLAEATLPSPPDSNEFLAAGCEVLEIVVRPARHEDQIPTSTIWTPKYDPAGKDSTTFRLTDGTIHRVPFSVLRDGWMRLETCPYALEYLNAHGIQWYR